jgi:phosphoglycolate phosphatase
MVNLIFDLDGTLIDSRLRLYRLFQHLVPQSKLTFESYWAFKQEKISNETILAMQFGLDSPTIARFVADWMDSVEAPEFLALDTNFPGMHTTLERLTKQAVLHVCTARQHRQPVIEQLEKLNLLHYFENVLVTEQSHTKEELIGTISGLQPQDWMIGDTGKDIQAGKVLGIKTCAVLSGFLNEKSLRPYCPDLIIPRAVDFRLSSEINAG